MPLNINTGFLHQHPTSRCRISRETSLNSRAAARHKSIGKTKTRTDKSSRYRILYVLGSINLIIHWDTNEGEVPTDVVTTHTMIHRVLFADRDLEQEDKWVFIYKC